MQSLDQQFICRLQSLGGSALEAPAADERPLQWAERVGIESHIIQKTVAECAGLRSLATLEGLVPSAEFTERIPIGYAREHGVLGFVGEEDVLIIALADWKSWPILDTLARFLRRTVEPTLVMPEQLRAAINAAYQSRDGQAQTLIDGLDGQDQILEEIGQLEGREDLLDVADRAPVIKLVNMILFEAVKGRASDVHIQPYEDRLVVRLRIDGALFDAFNVPKALQEEVVSRIKVFGRMNIAEKRIPQDGRATVQVGDRHIDLRIASLPTSFGERVVIRLLDKSARLYTLGELGMESTALSQFRDMITLEHGLILVTGPTGGGKSTTLYAALREIDSKDLNIVTLEDPIEYQLDGISQTQISEKKGMTFAAGLRSVLRQDPDIIMIGEIRDQETAIMAIQSALTGHLVFSTLHTNDAASAVTRLLDLGIEPFLVASSLVAVVAQRLVRRVCDRCTAPIKPAPIDLERLGIVSDDPAFEQVWQGAGCQHCRNTGYLGRLGVFEMLAVNDAIRECIQSRANASEIRNAAERHGMRMLRDDGLAKIQARQTTLEEITRITMRTLL
jgi:general secretion pathway protein E